MGDASSPAPKGTPVSALKQLRRAGDIPSIGVAVLRLSDGASDLRDAGLAIKPTRCQPHRSSGLRIKLKDCHGL